MAESSTREVGRARHKKDRISVLPTRHKKDRICVLPRNIQETILCFLPIRDAVRTSALSRYWRHCWTTIPNLAFDEDILSGILFGFDETVKFVSVINKVLLLHNGPILEFSLEFLSCSQLIHDYLDQWIPLFSRKGLKQLSLHGFDRWTVAEHNFSSLGLTCLRLGNIWFPCKPAFGGLNYLRIIELVGVAATEENIFDCPVLERLTLINSYGLSHSNFRAPNLKYLHQQYREVILGYSSAGLENLKEYSFRLSEYPPKTQPERPNVVNNVLSSLHNIEKFCVAKYFIKYLAAGGSPIRLSRPLPYLKTLSIFDIDLSRFIEVSCLLCLVRSAPNLCKLQISADPDPDLDSDDEEENLEDYCEEDYKDCAVDHLEIVTFSHFQGLKAEMELVKFLLARSPSLKTMFIHRDSGMKKDVAFKILEEMLEYSRASSRAQIKHSERPFVAVDYGPWVSSYDIWD